MTGAAAIILAAGRSTRMGRQKLLLPFAGTTMIGHVVKQVRESGVRDVIVVVGADGDAVRAALAGDDLRFVTNDRPDADMLSSVRTGLAAVPDGCAAAMVVLGDQPAVSSGVMRRLLAAHRGGITVPTCGGRRGHPILFDMTYRSEILTRFDDTGLRGLLAAHPLEVQAVDIEETGVLQDIDTEEAYREAMGWRPPD